MVVVGDGMKTAASVGVDSNGSYSVVQTNCLVVGPLFAAQTYAGGSVVPAYLGVVTRAGV
jgi:hypothetical protein